MKTAHFFLLLTFLSVSVVSCNFSSDTQWVNTDSLRADSLWRIAIADSINRARDAAVAPPPDTGHSVSDIETITRGMAEGLNKVQEGLDRVKKVTEVSANSAKAVTEGINKTKEAVNKTIEEARRAINGEPKPAQ